MDNRHIEIWNMCLSMIKDNIEPHKFVTWFKHIVPLSLNDNILTIQVPSQFYYKWFEDKYIDLLKTTLRQFLGPEAKLNYRTTVSLWIVQSGPTQCNADI